MSETARIRIKEYGLLILGTLIFQIGAVMLVEPYGFAPGGTYGLAMVFHHLFGWRTELMAVSMDVPLLIIGVIFIGARFGIKTLLSTILMPVFMWAIHQLYGYESIIEPGISDFRLFHDQVLASLFGGVVYGIGLGLVYKSRATTGGSDIIAMLMRKYTHMSMGTCTLIVDGCITFSTLIAFGDMKLPMYSWIIIFISSVIMDKIIEGPARKTLFIITSEVEKVRKYILDDMERGATLLEGKGLYSGEKKDVMYVTVTRREMILLKNYIASVDPRAFVNVVDSAEILGEGFNSLDGSDTI